MNEFKKTVEIIGGGTVSHVRSHLALSAVAYGETAKVLKTLCAAQSDKLDINLHLTRMANAGDGNLETVNDVDALVDDWVKNLNVKIVFFNVAMVDFEGYVYTLNEANDFKYNVVDTFSEVVNCELHGKRGERLKSRKKGEVNSIILHPTKKVIGKIRKERKDIFLVGFKTTCNATEDEQYIAGLNLLKESSCNLVLANDVHTRVNMIITPEEARYHVTTDRLEALKNLVEMTYLRSHLSFTHSTVVAGESVDWNSPDVPDSLRLIVNYCINAGAYKEFRGSTVGHFACKIASNVFLTSKRKTNFNDLAKIGLVRVVTDGPDTVTAFGAKPSVGGQSQRIIFSEHNDYDCIVHFHCEKKIESVVP